MRFTLLKRVLVGPPMPLAQARHERLRKRVALAVFSSDALSSVAYATEEILLILVLAGTVALHYSVPIALAITALLAIVTVSYQQTIHAYPSGGGSYIVSRENLGEYPSLLAGASLLGFCIGVLILLVVEQPETSDETLPMASLSLLRLQPYRLSSGRLPVAEKERQVR